MDEEQIEYQKIDGRVSAVWLMDKEPTVANFVEAMYALNNVEATGQKRCLMPEGKLAAMFTALTGSGAIYQNLPELIRDGVLPEGQPAMVLDDAEFAGQLFGVPIYQFPDDSANQAMMYAKAGIVFSAAPDLLKALQALGSMPEGYCFCRENRDPLKPEHEHTGECLAARAAIAKARGGAQ